MMVGMASTFGSMHSFKPRANRYSKVGRRPAPPDRAIMIGTERAYVHIKRNRRPDNRKEVLLSLALSD